MHARRTDRRYASFESFSPEKPSVWQLRFRSNRSNNNNTDEENTRGSQLFTLTSTMEKDEQPELDIGRACASELMGKPNAFLPRYKLPENDGAREKSRQDNQYQAAHDIVRSRFEVDKQAKAIKQNVARGQPSTATVLHPSKRTSELKTKSHQGVARPRPSRSNQSSERFRPAKTVGSKKEIQWAVPKTQTYRSGGQVLAESKAPNKVVPPNQISKSNYSNNTQAGKNQKFKSKNAASIKPVAVSNAVKQRSDAKPSKNMIASSDIEKKMTKKSLPAEESLTSKREEMRLDQMLKRLRDDNQRIISSEQKAQEIRLTRKLKRLVFGSWRRRVEIGKREMASAIKFHAWCLYQKVWDGWAQVMLDWKRERKMERVRCKLVEEKQQFQKATHYYWIRSVRRCFDGWHAFVEANKVWKSTTVTAEERLKKAKSLLERLTCPTKQEAATTYERYSDGVQEEAKAELPPTMTKLLPTSAEAETEAEPVIPIQPTKVTKPKTDYPIKASKKPDKPYPPPKSSLYLAMQKRASERQQRREALNQKYAIAEREKRERLAMQVADRESRLVEEHLQHRAKMMERKRQKQMAAKERAERQENFARQCALAKEHSQSRLLYYYGFLPWQDEWKLSRRVFKHAAKWSSLRLMHRMWTCWLQYVDWRYQVKQEAHRQKLRVADMHFHHVLRRKVFSKMFLHHGLMLSAQSKVVRLHKACALKISWKRWRNLYADIQLRERHALSKLRIRFDRSKRHRAFKAWQRIMLDQKKQRDKEATWARVRGWLNES